MKRTLVGIIILTMCFLLCACGSTEAAEPAAKPVPEATTKTVTEPAVETGPNIMLIVATPESWQNVELRVWKDGEQTKELILPVAGGFCEIPGWVDRVSISCNGGEIQTDELAIAPIAPEMPVEIHVVNEDYVFVHNEGPVDGEQWKKEEIQPAVDFNNSVQAVLEKGGYQVMAAKAVAFDERYENSERINRYSKDYIPAELLAETPEEIYYVLHIYDASEYLEYGDWQGKNKITAVKPGIRFEIWEIGTDTILTKSEPIMGGDPPQVISTGQSARGSEPKEEEINAWIESAFEALLNDPPKELPMIP